eukprot:6266932-Pyramimonas_sp.AAC.1
MLLWVGVGFDVDSAGQWSVDSRRVRRRLSEQVPVEWGAQCRPQGLGEPASAAPGRGGAMRAADGRVAVAPHPPARPVEAADER